MSERVCIACGAAYHVGLVRTSGDTVWAYCPTCGLLDDVNPVPDYGPIWHKCDRGVLPSGWQYDPTEPKIARVLTGNVQPWHDVLDGLLRVVPAVARSGVLLDVGCGAGEILDYARTLGHWSRVVGTEVVRHFVAFTRSRGHEIYYTDLATAPIPEIAGQVTLAVCNEVMEHIPDPVALLRGIGATLHPKGVLFVTFAIPLAQFDPGEWHYWTQEAARVAIHRAGLVTLRLTPGPFRIEILCRRSAEP